MKIYLAARYSRREELLSYTVELQHIGHEVTSRWLNGGHGIPREGLSEDSGFASEVRARFAIEDWDDLMEADAVISFTEAPRSNHSRGGRHVEFGAAVAASKRIIVVGYRENVFHCLPCVEFYSSWQELIANLEAETTGVGA